MLETLINWDTRLFLWFNGMHSPAWDQIMWWVSSKYFWIPLYIFILYLIVRKFRWKALVLLLLFVPLLITASDQLSSLLKDSIQRFRPCHTPEISSLVHLVKGHCGGKYGFVSSHAANAFAIWVFTASLFRWRWYTLSIGIWALWVGYSRIYLGVHFPGDILGGALLGGLIACIFYESYSFADRKLLKKGMFSKD